MPRAPASFEAGVRGIRRSRRCRCQKVPVLETAGAAPLDLALNLAFSRDAIQAATTVFDVVALPAETPLIRAAREAGKAVITGAEVIALQAAEQFERYTGVRPSAEQILAASEFSRS